MTLFPEQVRSFLETSITGRALKKGIFQLDTVQIRDFCQNRYGKVDDTMYGGGTGLLMQCGPVYDAHRSICSTSGEQKPYTVFMSPKGNVFNQHKAVELSQKDHLIILCGHYEGIDQRVIDEIVDEEISIGDYVLTGGEIAACVVIDAIARMIPGVLPDASAYENESHMGGVLEAPQYTKPETWLGESVPSILLSGHHEKIREWKRKMSLYETWKKRPDLFNQLTVSQDDWAFLLEQHKIYIHADTCRSPESTCNEVLAPDRTV
jgi:tRNA (guanine37-N1)-methyltransferase